jgi:hypothetical protein
VPKCHNRRVAFLLEGNRAADSEIKTASRECSALMENGTRRHDEDGVFKIIQLCHHETEKCIDTVMSYSE